MDKNVDILSLVKLWFSKLNLKKANYYCCLLNRAIDQSNSKRQIFQKIYRLRRTCWFFGCVPSFTNKNLNKMENSFTLQTLSIIHRQYQLHVFYYLYMLLSLNKYFVVVCDRLATGMISFQAPCIVMVNHFKPLNWM